MTVEVPEPAQVESKKPKRTPEEIREQIHRISKKLIERAARLPQGEDRATGDSLYSGDNPAGGYVLHVEGRPDKESTISKIDVRDDDVKVGHSIEKGDEAGDLLATNRVELDFNESGSRGRYETIDRGRNRHDQRELSPEQAASSAARTLDHLRGKITEREIAQTPVKDSRLDELFK